MQETDEIISTGSRTISLSEIENMVEMQPGKHKLATEEDLKKLFNIPASPVLVEETYPNGNSLYITYYPIRGQENKARKIRTHKTPKEYGISLAQTNSGYVVVPAIIDPSKHGDPCEAKSRATGETYPIVNYDFKKH